MVDEQNLVSIHSAGVPEPAAKGQRVLLLLQASEREGRVAQTVAESEERLSGVVTICAANAGAHVVVGHRLLIDESVRVPAACGTALVDRMGPPFAFWELVGEMRTW